MKCRFISKVVASVLTIIFGTAAFADDSLPLNINWPSANHDLVNSQNQLLELLISPLTIKNLGFSKQFIGGLNQQSVTVPVIFNNIAYYADVEGNVHAINILTGQKLFSPVHVSEPHFILVHQHGHFFLPPLFLVIIYILAIMFPYFIKSIASQAK